jgi:hypothetical protein
MLRWWSCMFSDETAARLSGMTLALSLLQSPWKEMEAGTNLQLIQFITKCENKTWVVGSCVVKYYFYCHRHWKWPMKIWDTWKLQALYLNSCMYAAVQRKWFASSHRWFMYFISFGHIRGMHVSFVLLPHNRSIGITCFTLYAEL